jgi:hypothetical protein
VADLVTFGDILLVMLPTHAPAGHEQEGVRPAVVVGLPERAGQPRFSTLLVIPLTTQEGHGPNRRHVYILIFGAAREGFLVRPLPCLTKCEVLMSEEYRAIWGA